jgi:hypothetical protein
MTAKHAARQAQDGMEFGGHGSEKVASLKYQDSRRIKYPSKKIPLIINWLC